MKMTTLIDVQKLKEMYARFKPHLSETQSIVAIVVGIVTIIGACYGTWRYLNPPPTTGRVEAVIQDSETGGPLAGAAVEILAEGKAFVVALQTDQYGRVGRTLKEGRYDVRVKREGYIDSTRGVQVIAGQQVDVTVKLVTPPAAVKGVGNALKKIIGK